MKSLFRKLGFIVQNTMHLPLLLVCTTVISLVYFRPLFQPDYHFPYELQAFGGVPFTAVSGQIDQISMGIWFFMLSPLMLYCALIVEQEFRVMSAYCLLRSQSYNGWWLEKQIQILLACFMYCSLVFIESALFRFLPAMSGFAHISVMSLFLLVCQLFIHLSLLMTVMGVIYLLTRNQTLSVAGVLLLTGGTMLMALTNQGLSKYMPGVWGMALRTLAYNRMQGYSVSTVMLVQAMILIAIDIITPGILKRHGMFAYSSL